MIRRRFSRRAQEDNVEPKGFDDFDLRLGDMMRGERATMGKSLLDVQRELRIKAAYIAAIENADPSTFDTPGFIAGYVRSYARYLGMDPERAFEAFCAESGFTTAHGMSAEASVVRKAPAAVTLSADRDPFAAGATPFAHVGDSLLGRIELRAVGSLAVLLALIATLSYGGWSVVREIQRVQVEPVEKSPEVLADLDPLAASEAPAVGVADMDAGRDDALDRLYRPQALDVPVLVARDAPIATLEPGERGNFLHSGASDAERMKRAVAAALEQTADVPAPETPSPKVVKDPAPKVEMVAVRPAWVRVRAADGTVLYEGIMNAGDRYTVPANEQPPNLRVGESGAVYFAVAGQHYGPAGESGTVTSGLALAADDLTARYTPADPTQDRDLARMVAELRARDAAQE
jgi:cytoskeletal protein RodZ